MDFDETDKINPHAIEHNEIPTEENSTSLHLKNIETEGRPVGEVVEEIKDQWITTMRELERLTLISKPEDDDIEPEDERYLGSPIEFKLKLPNSILDWDYREEGTLRNAEMVTRILAETLKKADGLNIIYTNGNNSAGEMELELHFPFRVHDGREYSQDNTLGVLFSYDRTSDPPEVSLETTVKNQTWWDGRRSLDRNIYSPIPLPSTSIDNDPMAELRKWLNDFRKRDLFDSTDDILNGSIKQYLELQKQFQQSSEALEALNQTMGEFQNLDTVGELIRYMPKEKRPRIQAPSHQSVEDLRRQLETKVEQANRQQWGYHRLLEYFAYQYCWGVTTLELKSRIQQLDTRHQTWPVWGTINASLEGVSSFNKIAKYSIYVGRGDSHTSVGYASYKGFENAPTPEYESLLATNNSVWDDRSIVDRVIDRLSARFPRLVMNNEVREFGSCHERFQHMELDIDANSIIALAEQKNLELEEMRKLLFLEIGDAFEEAIEICKQEKAKRSPNQPLYD